MATLWPRYFYHVTSPPDFHLNLTWNSRGVFAGDIEQCRIRPLQLDHPCHNQCVERHVKMVTEAAAQVERFERRDGLIRQKIKSRKLLKKFDTKVQF